MIHRPNKIDFTSNTKNKIHIDQIVNQTLIFSLYGSANIVFGITMYAIVFDIFFCLKISCNCKFSFISIIYVLLEMFHFLHNMSKKTQWWKTHTLFFLFQNAYFGSTKCCTVIKHPLISPSNYLQTWPLQNKTSSEILLQIKMK